MRIAIETYLKTAQEFILKDQREKGIYSSGESANSTRIEAKDNSGQLYGADYFTQQKQGRAPGKFPPIEAIIQWIKEKGIQKKDNISDRSLAFIIARKIAKSGTDIFTGKRKGLDFEEAAKRGLPALMEAYKDEAILKITRPLREMRTVILILLVALCSCASIKPAKTEKQAKKDRKALVISLVVFGVWYYGFTTYGE